jgi:hypothetical protein
MPVERQEFVEVPEQVVDRNGSGALANIWNFQLLARLRADQVGLANLQVIGRSGGLPFTNF